MRRPKTPLVMELPLIVFLGILWMAVWQQFDLGTLIIGLVYATIVVRVFYLPPLRGTGRINVFWALVFTVRFLGKMTWASFQVSWIVFAKGPRVKNSIISVQLRSHDDLMVTLVGHALALVPGSLMVEVDRTTATLYLHALNVSNDEKAEKITRDALRTEALLIRTCGNRSDLAVVKAEARLGRRSGFTLDELRRAPAATAGGTLGAGPSIAAEGAAVHGTPGHSTAGHGTPGQDAASPGNAPKKQQSGSVARGEQGR